MSQPIRLSDDGELIDAVDVPDAGPGVEIHFTTGREVVYPTPLNARAKDKRAYHRVFDLYSVPISTWLLVIGCLWALLVIILLVSFAH